MKGLALWFMVAGILSVLIGMVWGLQMASSKDHTMAPAHAHLNLIGFVSFSIFAFYYHAVPAAAEGLLPKLHFGLAVVGLLLVVPGISMSIRGTTEAVAAGGSVITALAMLCFLAVILRPLPTRG